MGSQTFEILRQGVWASLTGGWFYDPHQTVFCNVIHLYLWLFLLCGPFLTYLYFPTTYLTWILYCILTTITVSVLKILNMALHLLYDKAQTVSDPNFKHDTKSTKNPVSDECGIEMQVIGNDVPSRISIEQPINEVSEANSMLSLDHVTSTIDLKVDVHRKNSSESSDSISMYPPNIYQNVLQSNDNNQHTKRLLIENLQSSQNQLTETPHTAVSNKERELSRRYSDNLQKTEKSSEIPSQYSVPVFKDYTHNSMLVKHNPLRNRQHNRNFSQGQEFLSEIWKNTQLNGIQSPSPKALSCSLYQIKSAQESTFNKNCKTLTGDAENTYNQTEEIKRNINKDMKIDFVGRDLSHLIAAAIANESVDHLRPINFYSTTREGDKSKTHDTLLKGSTENNPIKKINKATKIQRHRSTESHEENQRHNTRNNLFKSPSRQDHTNLPIVDNNSSSSTLQLTTIKKQDNLPEKHPLVNSQHHYHHRLSDKHLRSSDMYLSNSNYTKSDLGIEQFEENLIDGSNDAKDVHSLLSLKKTNPMRKDSDSTMSALQLPVAASISNLEQQQNQNKRRHSNTSCKPEINNSGGSSGAISSSGSQSSNVRRIKSTALDVACPQPSVSNLSPHPNSTEAIAGQLKNSNPPLLPPPSKCLVRNQHLTFCSKFGGNIDNSNPNISINMENCGLEYVSIGHNNENSETVVYPIAEHIERVDENKTKSNMICPLSPNRNNDKEDQICKCENVENEDLEQNNKANVEKGNINENFDNNIICISDNNDLRNRDVDKIDKSNSSDDDKFESDGNDIACVNDNDDNLDGDNFLEMKPSSNTTESESEIERPRTLSTDSETDNNGSRSPLLNKSVRDSFKPKVVDVQQPKLVLLGNDKFNKNMKKSKGFGNNFNKQESNKSGVDSGCPSSDYEQVSSSSKDMLLDNAEKSNRKVENMCDKTCTLNEAEEKIKISNECRDQPRGLNIAQEEADIENLRLKDAKSLGAIPKTARRRSGDIPVAQGMGAPLGLTSLSTITTKRSVPKSMSRTSSSASSRSFSAESFSNDVYKTYRDRYSFILGPELPHQGFVPNSVHQSGFCGPINQSGFSTRRNINENLANFRLKRLNIIDPDNPNNVACLGTGRDGFVAGGIANSKLDENLDFGSDDLQKTHETATTLSIQGLMNEQYSFENSLASAVGDQRHSRHRTTRQSSSGAILNVEINDSIYCDYWRSCRLSSEKPVQPKKFFKYRWRCLGRHELKITMDRLQLLALFDRDLNWFHVILAIILSSLTCFLGSYILQLELYKDVFAFGFCIVIAGSQYSLLKSVQPDAASPIHGFNKTVAYSRPIYFCLCSSLLIFSFQLDERFKNEIKNGAQHTSHEVQFFGITFALNYIMGGITNFLSIILLLFPVFFSLGLFPQVNTFCMYLLEQIDMHIFGGNAVCSLLSSILCIFKSLIAVSILYGPAFGGLSEEKGTQHFLFSFFCSLLIPISYHLSRSASDFSHIWTLIKSGLANTIPDDDDDDEEEQKIISKKAVKKSISDDKSSRGQIEENSSTKVITSPPSNTVSDDTRNNIKTDPNQTSMDAGDTGDLSQQSKTICSIESKLDMSEDKTDANNQPEENELSTETLDSNSVFNGLESEQSDPLPKKLQQTVNSRLKNDLVVSTILAILVLGLHCSTVFTVLQPDLNTVLYIIAGLLGFILHYILPQMRKHMPWLCFAGPILRQQEFGQFEVSNAAKVMWFEAIYVCFSFLERNVLYPLIFISALTADSQNIAKKFGTSLGALIVAVCSLKCVRNAYSDPANQYLILIFSVLLFKLDFNYANETFLINFFIISILFKKSCDFLLKLQFIVTYIAPWQITWGSAFHAFAQPFSVPHSAMLFLQAGISAILSTPLNPFLGSAIFLTSYVRPIKFWERDYNTRRIDHSNTRLSSQLERDLGADDNNLNSIFYEHLTRSLQHSLCGDLLLGRWGNVNQGDCFVLASDYLNCLVHIIELGNGLCTFQMRGLEFRGTYCQQREVEAISEGVEDNDACCCCNPGHIPKMLSANAMFSTRWLAWQVVAAQYVLEGYSISENLATATLQPFEFRKVLITYYIKSIIYYVTKNAKLDKWLEPGPIKDSLCSTLSRQFVDLDPIFNYNLDEDFDFRALGITRSSFCSIYLNWIQLCYKKRKDSSASTNLPSTEVLTANVSAEQKICAENTKNVKDSADNMKGDECFNENLNAYKISDKNNDSSYNNSKSNCSDLKSKEDADFNNSRDMNAQSLYCDSTVDLQSKENSKNTDVNNLRDDKLDTTEKQISNVPTNRPTVRCRKKAYRRRLKFGAGVHTDPLKSILQTNSKSEPTDETSSVSRDSPLVSLCLALSLLARRSLATASHSSLSGVEFFLHGLHALFKGDFRITSPRDEWVFADMELLHGVVAPAVKMALKLHQDHFSSPDEYLDPSILYEAMSSHTKELVISHEADPIWRSAVLKGAPNLLALRHVMEDGSDEYRIIRLTKRFLSFRVIKLNRECVRGLWAGQQQELIYLRNRNPERGSIQNAKQALRNIINSSCDQPIGYPIYVSPLTTSYADTNEQICRIIGGAITLESIKSLVLESWRRIRERCREGCSSGSGGLDCDGISGFNEAPAIYFSPIVAANTTGNLSYGSQSLSGTGTRGSLASMNKPNSSTLLTTFLKRDIDQERDIARDSKVNNSCNRKHESQTNMNLTSKERDRRATLPITSTRLSTSSRDFNLKDSAESSHSGGFNKLDFPESVNKTSTNNKISNSSGNLQDYEHKIINNMGLDCSKSTECSTANEFDRMESLDENESQTDHDFMKEDTFCRVHIFKDQINHPLIELNRKAIIVDGLEIYDCLDLGRRIDVIWPNEKMRSNGGRSTWQNWSPQEGMVGYVRHYWQPNHPDARFRSNVNGTLYLIEINDHYVPVGECGVREYNQINPTEQQLSTFSSSNALASSTLETSESNKNYNAGAIALNKDNFAAITTTNNNNNNNNTTANDPTASSLALALKSLSHFENQPSSSSGSSATTAPEIFSPNTEILFNNPIAKNSSDYRGSLDIKSVNSFYLNFQFQNSINNKTNDIENENKRKTPYLQEEQLLERKINFPITTDSTKSNKFSDLSCDEDDDVDDDDDDDDDDDFEFQIEEKPDNVEQE